MLWASSDNRLCWWQLLCRKQQFLFFYFIASKYENESLVQDAMRLPSLKLQGWFAGFKIRIRGRKQKKTKANQKAFEANCNHLGLSELERGNKRIPWQGWMTMAGEPCFGCKGTWATRPPRLHRCALPHHQETLAPCDWKARQEVCAYSKYQLCFLEKCLLRSEFIFFLLHKCCLVAVNTKNTNLTLFSFS